MQELAFLTPPSSVSAEDQEVTVGPLNVPHPANFVSIPREEIPPSHLHTFCIKNINRDLPLFSFFSFSHQERCPSSEAALPTMRGGLSLFPLQNINFPGHWVCGNQGCDV